MTQRSKTISNRLRGIVQDRIDAVLEYWTSSLASQHQVHRLRVAIQRMRPALKVADKLLGTDFNLLLGRDLRWLHRKLGALRDWDVLLDGKQALIKEARETKLQNEWAKQLGRTTKAFGSPRATQLQKGLATLRALLTAANSSTPRGHPPAKAYENSLREFIFTSLDRRMEKMQGSLRKRSTMTNKRLHRIRKQVKKLRYASELFAVFLPNGVAGDNIGKLKSAQDALGKDHDMVARAQLIHSKGLSRKLWNDAGLKPPRRHVKEPRGRRLKKMKTHLRELQGMRPFWNPKDAMPAPSKAPRRRLMRT